MNDQRERARALQIERPVNSITLAAACDAAHVPISLGRRAIAMRLLFVMEDTAGKAFVSPDAVRILMELARRPTAPERRVFV